MRARKHGFTLIELMIVVAIIAIIAAIAIPSLLNARKAGNETSAIASLRSMTTVHEQYRVRFGSYPDQAGRLFTAGFIDGFTNSSGILQKSGYMFPYFSGPPITWGFQANPTDPGVTGDRYFWVDARGVITFNSQVPATSTDTPID